MLSSQRFMASQAVSRLPWESVWQPDRNTRTARSKSGFMSFQYAEIALREKAKALPEKLISRKIFR
jgi:hypothetical protein